MAVRWIVFGAPLFAFLTLCFLVDVIAEDGQWSEWLNWSQCSASCGRGQRKRVRFCQNPSPAQGGRPCLGRPSETEECEAPDGCLVDGQWGVWSSWSPCSVTCGEGMAHRNRKCDSPQPANGGRECDGSPEESMMCIFAKDCPRDGKWTNWSQWSSCSVTCGEGLNYRTRECNNPPPSAQGRDCPGTSQQSRVCRSRRRCSVNGHWSAWSEFEPCSVTCGKGVQRRSRKCDSPPPQNGGEDCDRSEAGETQEFSCNGTVVFCPVDGGWSDWGKWGPCMSPNCLSRDGKAYKMRQRSCNDPYPEHKGTMCQGAFLHAGMCDIPENCPVDGGWSDWSDWKCTRVSMTRSRTCDNPAPANGGKKCTGDKVDTHLREDQEEEYEKNCPDMPKEDDSKGDHSGDENLIIDDYKDEDSDNVDKKDEEGNENQDEDLNYDYDDEDE